LIIADRSRGVQYIDAVVIEAAQHVIVAPVDDATGWIDDVRQRHDPIAAAVPAHFTLVYPFEASIAPDSLRKHMVEVLAAFKEFHVVLDGLSGSERRYLRYDIKQGNDILIAMHDQLYSGHLDITESFQPHLTLGRIDDADRWRHALGALAATAPRTTVTVQRVISYRRYPDGTRLIDNSVAL
jgi:2'-5' RNA ligase